MGLGWRWVELVRLRPFAPAIGQRRPRDVPPSEEARRDGSCLRRRALPQGRSWRCGGGRGGRSRGRSLGRTGLQSSESGQAAHEYGLPDGKQGTTDSRARSGFADASPSSSRAAHSRLQELESRVLRAVCAPAGLCTCRRTPQVREVREDRCRLLGGCSLRPAPAHLRTEKTEK